MFWLICGIVIVCLIIMLVAIGLTVNFVLAAEIVAPITVVCGFGALYYYKKYHISKLAMLQMRESVNLSGNGVESPNLLHPQKRLDQLNKIDVSKAAIGLPPALLKSDVKIDTPFTNIDPKKAVFRYEYRLLNTFIPESQKLLANNADQKGLILISPPIKPLNKLPNQQNADDVKVTDKKTNQMISTITNKVYNTVSTQFNLKTLNHTFINDKEYMNIIRACNSEIYTLLDDSIKLSSNKPPVNEFYKLINYYKDIFNRVKLKIIPDINKVNDTYGLLNKNTSIFLTGGEFIFNFGDADCFTEEIKSAYRSIVESIYSHILEKIPNIHEIAQYTNVLNNISILRPQLLSLCTTCDDYIKQMNNIALSSIIQGEFDSKFNFMLVQINNNQYFKETGELFTEFTNAINKFNEADKKIKSEIVLYIFNITIKTLEKATVSYNVDRQAKIDKIINWKQNDIGYFDSLVNECWPLLEKLHNDSIDTSYNIYRNIVNGLTIIIVGVKNALYSNFDKCTFNISQIVRSHLIREHTVSKNAQKNYKSASMPPSNNVHEISVSDVPDLVAVPINQYSSLKLEQPLISDSVELVPVPSAPVPSVPVPSVPVPSVPVPSVPVPSVPVPSVPLPVPSVPVPVVPVKKRRMWGYDYELDEVPELPADLYPTYVNPQTPPQQTLPQQTPPQQLTMRISPTQVLRPPFPLLPGFEYGTIPTIEYSYNCDNCKKILTGSWIYNLTDNLDYHISCYKSVHNPNHNRSKSSHNPGQPNPTPNHNRSKSSHNPGQPNPNPNHNRSKSSHNPGQPNPNPNHNRSKSSHNPGQPNQPRQAYHKQAPNTNPNKTRRNKNRSVHWRGQPPQQA